MERRGLLLLTLTFLAYAQASGPLAFKATTDNVTTDGENHILFQTVVRNTMDAKFDTTTGTLAPHFPATYAFSVCIKPFAGIHPAAECEIVVDGVETPLVLNDGKTCARVTVTLDGGHSVWVEYRGSGFPVSTSGVFSACLLARN